MDDKSRDVFLKLLKAVVGDISNNKEWEEYHNWFLLFKNIKSCPVTFHDADFWTTKQLRNKNHIWLTLRNCLLNHRWKEALEALVELAETASYPSIYTIPRVTMELVHQLGASPEFVDEMIAASKHRSVGLSKKEFNIDYFLYNLMVNFPKGSEVSLKTVQKFAELSKILDESIKRVHNYRYFNSISEKMNSSLYDTMYRGLFSYAKWLLTKLEIEKINEEDSEQKRKLIEILMIQHKEANEHISRGMEEDGNWSSFVSKVVEMVEFQAIIEENKELILKAEAVLLTYMKKNKDELSCKKMLYFLYNKHSDIFPHDKQLELLRELSTSHPHDLLVLDLAKIEDRLSTKIKLLVSFLHFNKTHHKTWMQFLSILQNNVNSSDKKSITKTLKRLVSQRELHKSMFYHNSKTPVTDLILLKASVACLLMGKKCQMYKSVAKSLKKMATKPSLNYLFESVKNLSYNIDL